MLNYPHRTTTRCLLIGLDDGMIYVHLPAHLCHHGMCYQMPEHNFVAPIEVDEIHRLATFPSTIKLRTFFYRGQINRVDGSPLVHFFEEVTQ